MQSLRMVVILLLLSTSHLFLCQIILRLFDDLRISFTYHKESSLVLPPWLLGHTALFIALRGRKPEKTLRGACPIDSTGGLCERLPWAPCRNGSQRACCASAAESRLGWSLSQSQQMQQPPL